MKVATILAENVVFEGMTEDIVKKYNITERGPASTGLDKDKGMWYGWSHRAVHGFKIGDKLFDEHYKPEDKTDAEMERMKFSDRGSKTIKTLNDAKQAAVNFSHYVS